MNGSLISQTVTQIHVKVLNILVKMSKNIYCQ